jgi:hypothetical protein
MSVIFSSSGLTGGKSELKAGMEKHDRRNKRTTRRTKVIKSPVALTTAAVLEDTHPATYVGKG